MLERSALKKFLRRLWPPLQVAYALLVVVLRLGAVPRRRLLPGRRFLALLLGLGRGDGREFYPALYLNRELLFVLAICCLVAVGGRPRPESDSPPDCAAACPKNPARAWPLAGRWLSTLLLVSPCCWPAPCAWPWPPSIRSFISGSNLAEQNDRKQDPPATTAWRLLLNFKKNSGLPLLFLLIIFLPLADAVFCSRAGDRRCRKTGNWPPNRGSIPARPLGLSAGVRGLFQRPLQLSAPWCFCHNWVHGAGLRDLAHWTRSSSAATAGFSWAGKPSSAMRSIISAPSGPFQRGGTGTVAGSVAAEATVVRPAWHASVSSGHPQQKHDLPRISCRPASASSMPGAAWTSCWPRCAGTTPISRSSISRKSCSGKRRTWPCSITNRHPLERPGRLFRLPRDHGETGDGISRTCARRPAGRVHGGKRQQLQRRPGPDARPAQRQVQAKRRSGCAPRRRNRRRRAAPKGSSARSSARSSANAPAAPCPRR